MATHTIIINTKSIKAKYLLNLIKEISKDDNNIAVDPMPNKVTLKAIEDAKSDKVFKAKDADDLFNQLNN